MTSNFLMMAVSFCVSPGRYNPSYSIEKVKSCEFSFVSFR